jgi:hypothetical protein
MGFAENPVCSYVKSSMFSMRLMASKAKAKIALGLSEMLTFYFFIY